MRGKSCIGEQWIVVHIGGIPVGGPGFIETVLVNWKPLTEAEMQQDGHLEE